MNEKKFLRKIEDLRQNVRSRRDINYPKIIYNKFPEKYRKKIEEEAEYAGIRIPIYKHVTNTMKIIGIAELFVILVLIIFFDINAIMTVISIVLAIAIDIFGPYTLVSILAENNRRKMTEVLPDFLILVAANIRSGQTIEKAMMFSARDEFGALSYEIKKCAIKIYGGIPIEEALLHLSDRIKSFTFKRTVNLVNEGLKSGADIALILDESAADIQNTKTLLKEISTSVQMMVMFIFIAGVLAAPAMFAISNYLVVKTTDMWSGIDSSAFEGASAGGGVMSYFKFSESNITPEFFNMFSMYCILITCFFGGLIVSQIQKGNMNDAVKYIPVFSIVAISIYLGLRMLLFQVLGVL